MASYRSLFSQRQPHARNTLSISERQMTFTASPHFSSTLLMGKILRQSFIRRRCYFPPPHSSFIGPHTWTFGKPKIGVYATYQLVRWGFIFPLTTRHPNSVILDFLLVFTWAWSTWSEKPALLDQHHCRRGESWVERGKLGKLD